MADEIIVRTLSELEEACRTPGAYVKLDKDIIIDQRYKGMSMVCTELDLQGHAIRSALLTNQLFEGSDSVNPRIKNGKILDMYVESGNMFLKGGSSSRNQLRFDRVSISVNLDGINSNTYLSAFYCCSFNLCNIDIAHSSGLKNKLFGNANMVDSRLEFDVSHALNGGIGFDNTYTNYATGCSFEGTWSGSVDSAMPIGLKSSVWAVNTTELTNTKGGKSVSIDGTGMYDAEINPNASASSTIYARDSISILSPAYNNDNGFPVIEVV